MLIFHWRTFAYFVFQFKECSSSEKDLLRKYGSLGIIFSLIVFAATPWAGKSSRNLGQYVRTWLRSSGSRSALFRFSFLFILSFPLFWVIVRKDNRAQSVNNLQLPLNRWKCFKLWRMHLKIDERIYFKWTLNLHRVNSFRYCVKPWTCIYSAI